MLPQVPTPLSALPSPAFPLSEAHTLFASPAGAWWSTTRCTRTTSGRSTGGGAHAGRRPRSCSLVQTKARISRFRCRGIRRSLLVVLNKYIYLSLAMGPFALLQGSHMSGFEGCHGDALFQSICPLLLEKCYHFLDSRPWLWTAAGDDDMVLEARREGGIRRGVFTCD